MNVSETRVMDGFFLSDSSLASLDTNRQAQVCQAMLCHHYESVVFSK